MKTKITELRVALHARMLDLQQLEDSSDSFFSAPLSLASERLTESRMLLGDVLKLTGEATPYPHADNAQSPVISPAADVVTSYTPDLPLDHIAAVKTVRASLQVALDEMATQRRGTFWARDYGTLPESIYDAAFLHLTMAKNWLGQELARIAQESKSKLPVAPPPAPASAGVPSAPAPVAQDVANGDLSARKEEAPAAATPPPEGSP